MNRGRQQRLLRAAGEICVGIAVLLASTSLLRAQAEVRKPPEASLPPRPPAEPARGDLRAPGGIVAVVGSDVITQAELDRRVRQRKLQLAKFFPQQVLEREIGQIERDTLQQMVTDRMVTQLVRQEERKAEGRTFITPGVIDMQVAEQVERIKKTNPSIKTPEDLYRAVRDTEGLTRSEYRMMLKERLEVDGYIHEHVLKRADVYVSPEKVRIYYDTHQDEFTTPVEISFRQIRVMLQREDAQARIQAIEKGIADGVPFEDLARKYSEEVYEGTPDLAGYLWKKSFEELKSWHRPIPDILRKMKKGETSQRVLTVRGVYYFHIVDLVEGDPKSYAEVQEMIHARQKRILEDSAIRTFVEDLRDKFHPQIYLKALPGSKDASPEGTEGSAKDGAEESSNKDSKEDSKQSSKEAPKEQPESSSGGGGSDADPAKAG